MTMGKCSRLMASRMVWNRAVFAVASTLLCVLAMTGCGSSAESHYVPGADEAQGAVYNAVQREWYGDVQDAFAAADNGDVLYFYEDVKTEALASEAANLSVDLQGHEFAIDAIGSGARGGQGLAHSALALGTGDCTLSNGSITAVVGAQPETVQSAASQYRGIAAGDINSLVLSNVQVEVTYAGASTIAPAVQLVGLEAGGSLSLENGSSIVVKSAMQSGSYGATTVAGIHATGGSDSSITVPESSSIRVSNSSSQVVQGAIGYPGAIYGTTKESNAELVEIQADASLDWYGDLLDRFRANAKFDDRADADGFVYGAEVYYAPSLELENGLKVWAFSNPVNAAAAGALESVKPDHVFARSDYALPLDAYGIWCAEGFEGSVSQSGEVEARTTLGHAVGVYEAGSGSYEVAEDAINALCEDGAYRTSAGPFDLGDYVDLPVGTDVDVAYPQQSTYEAVRRENSVAWTTAVAGGEPWSYETAPIPFYELFSDWDTRAAIDEAENDEEQTIGLTLVYYRMDKDGSYLYTAEDSGTYVYSPDLDLVDVANEKVALGDIVEVGGIANVFTGWSPRMSDVEPLYTDHIYLQKENWGSFGAKLVLYGLYQIAEETDEPPAQTAGGVEDGAEQGVSGSASTQSATSAQVVPVEQLPAGKAGSGVEENVEQFSPAGGIAVLAVFATVIVAICVAWSVRGRALVVQRFEVEDELEVPQTVQRGSGEQQRKGGIFF